jgi:predicted lipoprotein
MNSQGEKKGRQYPVLLIAILAIAAAGLLWIFPLFRVVPLQTAGNKSGSASQTAAFDPAAAALQIWKTDLPAAAQRAPELKSFAAELRENPTATQKKIARAAGLGTAYYFVRGSGKVVAVDRNSVKVALEGEPATIVALRVGPVFGNTVRDGCGLLEVNAFPGLQEFNALSAELNALVEKNVIPILREKADVGAEVQFAGCAEAPETVGGADEPLLNLIPVEATIR